MFYHPISVREAVENVNETWYLPAIQRPYDWGERHEKEGFIYKLFDSLLREYPIGTLIIWQTSRRIPFRPFLEDYDSEKLTKISEKGLWGKEDKQLIYDGQQRLQSLFSCLKFTFHGRVLCYNLLFDPVLDKGPNGFRFFTKHEEPDFGYIRMNELYCCTRKQLAEFEDDIIDRLHKSRKDFGKKEEIRAKSNLKQLWKLFIDIKTKLLAYYPLHKDLDETEVLDIFKRINTTGMELKESEILFSEIKRVQFDFEEKIWEASLKIKNQTNGFSFSPDSVLQILNLLVKGTVRVDPERVDRSELAKFVTAWSELDSPLRSFFYDFLYREFAITDERIIASRRAMIPLVVYFYYMRVLNQRKFKNFSSKSIKNLRKFFVFSQVNYWDLQGYIDNFHRIIKSACEMNKNCDFPFQKLRNFANKKDRRFIDMDAYRDLDYAPSRWFVLKMLTPNRAFSFAGQHDDRSNPEIDHIFPQTPQSKRPYPKKYYKWVETVWNMQPVKGEINNYKRAQSPKVFFSQYPHYLKDYDFIPTRNLNDDMWLEKNAADFIQARKKKIIAWINQCYDITVKS